MKFFCSFTSNSCRPMTGNTGLSCYVSEGYNGTYNIISSVKVILYKYIVIIIIFRQQFQYNIYKNLPRILWSDPRWVEGMRRIVCILRDL